MDFYIAGILLFIAFAYLVYAIVTDFNSKHNDYDIDL